MNKKTLVSILAVVILASVHLAEAQQPKKVLRIGYLSASSCSESVATREAFRQGLREFGYVEGQNIVIECRSVEGKFDRVPDLVADLVRLKVDIIVTSSSRVALAAKKVTTTIPIVMAYGGDPFQDGLVASLARPGGNVTGLTNLSADLSGKQLELLKEIIPRLARVAVLPNPTGPDESLKEMKAVAPSLQIQLQVLKVRVADDLERAFKEATKARAGALAVMQDPTGLYSANRQKIVELAVKNRLPAIYPQISYVNAGGLMSYSANEIEMYRRAATYVDKILKGIKPADLPVEQPTKFEFIINLKAAKQIGLTIPPNVLVRADKVIK
jgi:putative tryptophan/tyrosine transport system substrate-binding protein